MVPFRSVLRLSRRVPLRCRRPRFQCFGGYLVFGFLLQMPGLIHLNFVGLLPVPTSHRKLDNLSTRLGIRFVTVVVACRGCTQLQTLLGRLSFLPAEDLLEAVYPVLLLDPCRVLVVIRGRPDGFAGGSVVPVRKRRVI